MKNERVEFRYRRKGERKWRAIEFDKPQLEAKLRKIIFSKRFFTESEDVFFSMFMKVFKKRKEEIIKEILG